MNDDQKLLKQYTTLESDRILLRPFKQEDSQDVYAYASDDLVTRYLTWPTHKTLAQSEKVVETYYMDGAGKYAIELKSERKCIGCIDLRLCEEHHKLSFGYVLNRDYWNKGYMTEALKLVLNLSFTTLGLNRVEATHYVGNEASGKVMKKCGMKYEGTGKEEVYIKGIYFDVCHYGITVKQYLMAPAK